jgi:hypothetical protein
MNVLVAIGLSAGLIMSGRPPSLFAPAASGTSQPPSILQLPDAEVVRCEPEPIPETQRRKLRSVMLFAVGGGFPPDREIQLLVDTLGAVVTLIDMQWRLRPDGQRGLSNSVVFFQGESARGNFVYEREDFPSSSGGASSGVTHRALEPAELSRALVLRDWLLQRRCDIRRG